MKQSTSLWICTENPLECVFFCLSGAFFSTLYLLAVSILESVTAQIIVFCPHSVTYNYVPAVIYIALWLHKLFYMRLDLTKQGFDAQSFVRRYGDFKESLCNNFPVPTAVQTKFAPIVHLFTSYH